MKAFEATNSLSIRSNIRGSGAAAMSGMQFDPPSFDMQGQTIGLGTDNQNRAGVMRQLRSLTTTTGGLVPNLEDFDIRMSDLHNMMARLVPLLFVFIGAIPAAIAGIYTLAAAAAAAAASLLAIAGFGALGLAMEGGQFNAQNLSEAFDQVRQDFLDAFAPLANRLQPLFEEGLAGLERFFDAVAAEGDALVALTDEARAFGGFVLEFVPEALRSIAALVSAFSGIFADIGNFLNRNFAQMMQEIVGIAYDAIPALAQMSLVLGRMLPTLVKLSVGFMTVAKWVIQVFGAFGRLLSILPIGAEMFGAMTATVLAISSAVFLLNSAVLAVTANLIRRFGQAILVTIGRLTGFRVATYLATIAGWNLYRALAAIVGLTGIGLILVGISAAASTMAGQFDSAKNSIDQTARALEDFKSIQNGMGGGFGGGDNPYGYNPDEGDDAPSGAGMTSGGVTVFNVESSGDPEEDRSNLEYADWLTGRTTGQ